MTATKRLYEEDAYCRTFTATVLDCTACDGGYAVVLDQTAFFPEGGGQAADGGTLNGFAVRDVQMQDDVITHYVDAPQEVGSTVTGELDWERRFARMQCHAAEHIAAGLAHTMYGCNNVGFHLSERELTMDLDKLLSAEQIAEIERLANEAIYRNVAITATFPTKEELATIAYRSKLDIDEGIRLITIDGVDCCACCAPHPARTGEIGVLKILDFCAYKGGTRITMTAGRYAFEDYVFLHNENKELMRLLSASRAEVKDTVFRRQEQLSEVRAAYQEAAKKLALYELDTTAVGDAVYAFAEGLSYDELRYCANALIERGAAGCVLLSRDGETGYLYVASSAASDVRPWVQALNGAFGGKGGGKPNYAQGKLTSGTEAEMRRLLETLL